MRNINFRLTLFLKLLAIGLLLVFLLSLIGPERNSQAQLPVIGGCPIFPADNIWNVPINNLPVDPNSNAYINSIGSATGLHPDFGSGLYNGAPIGIPFVVVPPGQTKVPVSFLYDSQSDHGNYPIPPDAPIEGGSSSTGDRHVLVVQQGQGPIPCTLYETYNSFPQNGGTSWKTDSGAIYDLTSNAPLRPSTWTSADAAGLPILPGLARYDEVAAGEIHHALRFTVVHTRNSFIWPARHQASSSSNAAYPPMGQRFRLKAGVNISSYSHDTQVILTALKTYGMIVADNGSNWYISGAPDPGWNNDSLVTDFGKIKGSDFEAVDESSLQINVDSGQAKLIPAAPTLSSVIAASSSQINLSWVNNAVNQSGFYIERSTTLNGGYTQIAMVGDNATTYQDTGLQDNTLYYYRISAYNTWGTSAYSASLSATTPLAPPTPPGGLFVWATTANQTKLVWSDNSHNEDSFTILRSTDQSAWTQIGSITAPNVTSGTDNTVSGNTVYYYQIKAHNSAGDTYSTTRKVDTTLWPVSNTSDDGAGSSNNMLSFAIAHATDGQSITFPGAGLTINVSTGASWPPTLANGVNFVASCGASGPTVIINGSALPSGSNGLILNHNVVIGLGVTKFTGIPQLFAPTTGTANYLNCVAAKH
jgi:hypothetical protein